MCARVCACPRFPSLGSLRKMHCNLPRRWMTMRGSCERLPKWEWVWKTSADDQKYAGRSGHFLSNWCGHHCMPTNEPNNCSFELESPGRIKSLCGDNVHLHMSVKFVLKSRGGDPDLQPDQENRSLKNNLITVMQSRRCLIWIPIQRVLYCLEFAFSLCLWGTSSDFYYNPRIFM